MQGESFLTLTQGQFHPMVYQVTHANYDSVKLICLSWGTDKKFSLSKIPNKGEQELDSIRKRLMKQIWKTSEVLKTSFSDDTANAGDEYLFVHYGRDTTLIERKDLVDRKVSLKFAPDFTFHTLVDDKSFWQSNWRLSNDGTYIIIGDGLHTNNYIEIISIGANDLIIGKTDYFGTGKRREFIELYYEIKLM